MKDYNWNTQDLAQYDDFLQIVLKDIPLIDVRANIEFVKGSFPHAKNLPLMDDEQRHIIGKKYKDSGKEEAVAFATSLVTREIKEERISYWKDFLHEHPEAMLFCFRGGMRSKISQYWIYEETGVEIPRLKGGYKAFRSFLLESMKPHNIRLKPVIVSGYTGSGKTLLLQEIENALDLEKLAHHRGSTFGRFANAQPSQIDFEHALVYDLLKLQHHPQHFQHMILEDESRHIGLSFLDDDLFAFFKSGDWILLECDIKSRVEILANEYIFDSQKNYLQRYPDAALKHWYEDVNINLDKIQKKLGFDKHRNLKRLFQENYETQRLEFGEDFAQSLLHYFPDQDRESERESRSKVANLQRLNGIYYDFIESLLVDYYDKMYSYQLSNKPKKPIFTGNHRDVIDFIKENLH